MACKLIAAIALPLCLAACGSKGGNVDARNESVKDVNAKIAAAGANVTPEPGRWQFDFKTDKMDIPGLPPQVQAAMAKRMGEVRTHFTCITPEEAKAPDAKMFQEDPEEGCKYNHFTMSGGHVDSEMACKDEEGTAIRKLSGSYSDTSFDMKMDVSGAKGMKMLASVTAHRVGACTGKEEM